MGQITKRENEDRKAQKREAKAQKREERRIAKAGKRPENTRVKIIHYLIVCEGEKTEPNYFNRLIESYRGSIVIDAEIEGKGMCTSALVEYAQQQKVRLEREKNISFDRIWVVFDKDDFEDFNEAIKLCSKCGFEAGWTNEAFELWYYLHFEYIDAKISRHDYIDKLEKFIRKYDGYENFKYEKNDEHFYNILQQLGKKDNEKKEVKAIKFARKLRNLLDKEIGSGDYANAKPCTMVDILVEELRNPDDVWKKILNCQEI